jgi:hypothetical protein
VVHETARSFYGAECGAGSDDSGVLGCAAVVFRVEEGREREEMAKELAEVVDK